MKEIDNLVFKKKKNSHIESELSIFYASALPSLWFSSVRISISGAPVWLPCFAWNSHKKKKSVYKSFIYAQQTGSVTSAENESFGWDLLVNLDCSVQSVCVLLFPVSSCSPKTYQLV